MPLLYLDTEWFNSAYLLYSNSQKIVKNNSMRALSVALANAVLVSMWLNLADSVSGGRPCCSYAHVSSAASRQALRVPESTSSPARRLCLRGGSADPQVIVYMEGTPETPASDEGRDLLSILHKHQIEFVARDVGADRLLRETVARSVDWKTFPQVHCNGRLLGDVHIVKELAAAGELQSELGAFQCMPPPVDADPAAHTGTVSC